MARALLALMLAMWAMPVGAQQIAQIAGSAAVVDSTVIEIDGQRVMLFGVDSVMRKQICTVDGKPWQCWPAAVRDLQTLVYQGPAVCDPVGQPDVYGRVLARCAVNGQSLNEELVRRGYAVARPNETTDYVAAEVEAKQAKRGLWQGQFMRPSDFRRAVGIFVDRP
jgi:endonuclease YncB( thermonuclease family)